MSAKILCVDDELKVLKGLRRQLYENFDVEFAEGPERALRMLESHGPFGVVLADMRMPVMDGAQLLAIIRERSPDSVRMMLTGNSDLETAVRAVNEGNIFRFLNKPCAPDDLERALNDGLEQYRLINAEREVLEQTLNGSVKVLTEILSISDPCGFQHADELKDLVDAVAEDLKVPEAWELQLATMLAHLGRVAVPPETLQKAESGEHLSNAERVMIDSIPAAGADLIQNIPRLGGVAETVRQQAADFESEGETTPPIGARILRVLTEMTRMEDTGLDRQKALAGMRDEPQAFDPKVVKSVANCLGFALSRSGSSHEISFSRLKPGHILAAPLVTTEGRMILGKGHLIGHVLLGRLRNHQQVTGFREPIHIENEAASKAHEMKKSA